MDYYDEDQLDKLISQTKGEIQSLKGEDYFSTQIQQLKELLNSVRNRSEGFKLQKKGYFEFLLAEGKKSLDSLSRASYTTYVTSLSTSNNSQTHYSTSTQTHPPKSVVTPSTVSTIAAKPKELRAKTKVFIWQGDFPALRQELSKICADLEYVEWTEDQPIPENKWLFHFEDVIARLDDDELPKRIKNWDSKWNGRYVFVQLCKRGGTAHQNYTSKDYENQFIPGIKAVKGVYNLRMTNSGINDSATKEISVSDDLRAALQKVAKQLY